MNVPDINVLVALFRPEHLHHSAATAWFGAATTRGESFTIPDIVLVGFTRVACDPRIFEPPATFDEAWEFVLSLRAQPTHLVYVADQRVVDQFARLMRGTEWWRDQATDAYIAACAAVYGGTVVTFDRDFRKFDDLRVLELTA